MLFMAFVTDNILALSFVGCCQVVLSQWLAFKQVPS